MEMAAQHTHVAHRITCLGDRHRARCTVLWRHHPAVAR